MTFDLSVLTAPERDVIAYSMTLCGEPCEPIWVKIVDLLALTPLGKKHTRLGAYDRLCAPTMRRGPILQQDKWGYYRVDPTALGKYLASKKPKKEKANA